MVIDQKEIRRWARICENLNGWNELYDDKIKFIGTNSSYENSKIVVVGVPYDKTVTYRNGASMGPDSIRQESESAIETWSPYQNADLKDANICDAGNLEVQNLTPMKMVETVSVKIGEILSDGKFPVIVGGEHLVTLGAVMAAAKKYPGLHLIHFDAHSDLRNDYEGQELSHATVIRRCYDILGDGRIWQFGIRSGSEEEIGFSKDGHVTTEMFGIESVPYVNIPESAPVYVTVDMDVLDPSEFPGTGTPESGGVTFSDLLSKLVYILRTFNVIGLDNVELAPKLDQSGISTALACKLLREELVAVSKGAFSKK